MLRIGLSGGIGSGKSAVASRLAALGADIIDSDRLARDVVAPGTPGLAQVAEAFGPTILTPEGELDRPALGRLVFGDDAARRRLEAITHPLIGAEVERRLGAAAPGAVVVHDVPLLVELGFAPRYHAVVIVAASDAVRLARLVRDRGMSEADARARMAAQADDAQRRAAADIWLPNEGDLATLDAAVQALWRERLAPWASNIAAGRDVRRPTTVALADPDPEWRMMAARQVRRLRHALDRWGLGGQLRGIDHIGSTAVPGLPAKPVIDLQVRVADLGLAETASFQDALRWAGLVPVGPRQDEVHAGIDVDPAAWRKHLARGTDPAVVHHVHVRSHTSAGARTALLVRDWLRRNPDERDAYADAKRRAASLAPGGDEATRGDYTAAKAPWFAAALPRALAWAAVAGWRGPVDVERPSG